MNSLKFLVLAITFFTIDEHETMAQTNNKSEPTCTHVVNKSYSIPIIQYLHGKYGIEKTEKILLNLRAYEEQNHVRVLFEQEYLTIKSDLEKGLSQTTDLEIQKYLEARILELVNFKDIELNLIN